MRINLASTRLAFFLIAAIVSLLVLSAIIPQQEIALGRITDLRAALGGNYYWIETLGLDRIYTTPLLYVVLTLLAVNLLVGNFKRFKQIYRVERTLIKARYMGSILFHLSLVLVIVAITANYLYKYDGVLALTEGQRIQDKSEVYFREFLGPLEDAKYDRFSVLLEKVELNRKIEESQATVADLAVWTEKNDAPERKAVRINRPLVINDLEIHYGLTYGYSPELVLLDSSDQTLFAGFVRLATQNNEGQPLYEDFFVHNESGLHVYMTVEPDSVNIDSSSISVRVEREGSQLISSTVIIGDTIQVEGWKIAFPRIRRWCYLNVVENPWLNWVFAGFWSALFGLTMSFVPGVVKQGKKK